MKNNKCLSQIIILSILSMVLISCNGFHEKIVVTLFSTSTSPSTLINKHKPTLKSTLVVSTFTPEPIKPSSTLTPHKSIPSKITITPTKRLTIIGTPLNNFFTIPIPADAVPIYDDGAQYHFMTRQSPSDISNYYQYVLPLNGWGIQQVSAFEAQSKDGIIHDYIGIAMCQINGLFCGSIAIEKITEDDMTLVYIGVFNPD